VKRLGELTGSVPAYVADALADERDALREQHAALRKWLWLNHGCRAGVLYGNDGEMQCNNVAAHPGNLPLDFKRDELVRLVVAANNGAEREQHAALTAVVSEYRERGERCGLSGDLAEDLLGDLDAALRATPSPQPDGCCQCCADGPVFPLYVCASCLGQIRKLTPEPTPTEPKA
jgi:hypothetical protein